VEFERTEIVYYAAVLLFGCLGGLARLLRDQTYPGFHRSLGSILSSGIVSFGGVALWIGRSPDSIVGPIYYLAVAVFVGYFTLEVTEFAKTVIKKVLRAIFRGLGFEVEEESDR